MPEREPARFPGCPVSFEKRVEIITAFDPFHTIAKARIILRTGRSFVMFFRVP